MVRKCTDSRPLVETKAAADENPMMTDGCVVVVVVVVVVVAAAAAAAAAAAVTAANGENVEVKYEKDDATYLGGIVDGKREGYGVYKSNIETYEGQWKNDKQHGNGKHSWNDGRSYEGQYVNGRFSGKGKMVWTTDKGIMTYEGDYLDDAKHGFGKFTWPNMNVYEGGWQTGKRHGKATFTTHQGKQKVGFWQEDKFVRWEAEENAVAG
eukprot:s1191_g13.t1